jgi:hypothetical protein
VFDSLSTIFEIISLALDVPISFFYDLLRPRESDVDHLAKHFRRDVRKLFLNGGDFSDNSFPASLEDVNALSAWCYRVFLSFRKELACKNHPFDDAFLPSSLEVFESHPFQLLGATFVDLLVNDCVDGVVSVKTHVCFTSTDWYTRPAWTCAPSENGGQLRVTRSMATQKKRKPTMKTFEVQVIRRSHTTVTLKVKASSKETAEGMVENQLCEGWEPWAMTRFSTLKDRVSFVDEASDEGEWEIL